MTSCKTVGRFVGFREGPEAVSVRLGIKNIGRVMKGVRKCHVGSLYDPQFEAMTAGGFDMCLVTAEKNYDKHLEYLDFAWPVLSENGIIVMEGLTRNAAAKQAFAAFCKSKNREPAVFRTRYGTGLIQK